MSAVDEAPFAKLRGTHTGAALEYEGGKPLVLISKFSFKVRGKDVVTDVLLSPRAEQGDYKSRLYFKDKVEGTNANWTQQIVLGSRWWVASWKNVPTSMPWSNMIFEHLRAFE